MEPTDFTDADRAEYEAWLDAVKADLDAEAAYERLMESRRAEFADEVLTGGTDEFPW
jgi:hypothetical protein